MADFFSESATADFINTSFTESIRSVSRWAISILREFVSKIIARCGVLSCHLVSQHGPRLYQHLHKRLRRPLSESEHLRVVKNFAQFQIHLSERLVHSWHRPPPGSDLRSHVRIFPGLPAKHILTFSLSNNPIFKRFSPMAL